MNVSKDTIRRDLQELANKGKLLKVHGGALSLDVYRGSNPQGPAKKQLHSRNPTNTARKDHRPKKQPN